jgi:molybdopterin-containing oxidoreductase family membrane subunit
METIGQHPDSTGKPPTAPPAAKVYSYRDVNREILRTLSPPGRAYYLLVALAFTGVLIGASCWAYQISTGMGVAGIKHPVVWGTYLINFVFWVGIAHSGTLISAILFLFRAPWRTAIARSSEAMTVFAVSTAGLFPLIHLGRVWIVYWILPYPNQRNLWPNFQSPLVFDVIAISTYLTVSSLFWYTGLMPDLAIVRDNSTGLKRKIYGILSLGWEGTHRQWNHYGTAYLLFAALATPLVISVHSVVSWDFALAIVPGWHSTIFAPYFVAGAIHSGLAMVITLLIPLRRVFRLEDMITVHILENLAKTIILTGLIVGYAYGVEFFLAWYSGNMAEWDTFIWRAKGAYATGFWIMVICNAIVPLVFFWKKARTNLVSLFITCVLINIGMWFERYVIIITSIAHEFDPYSWGLYSPTWVEFGIMIGSFSLFFFLFLLFVKFLPSVSITEVKESLTYPVRGRRGGP